MSEDRCLAESWHLYWVSSGLEERWDPDCLAWCREGATEHFAEDLEQVMEVARWHVCFVLFSQIGPCGPMSLSHIPKRGLDKQIWY